LSKFIPLRPAKLGQTEVLDGSAILKGRTEEPNRGPDGARRGQTGPNGGPNRVVDGSIIYF
jgi:hypothetical protein